MTRTGDRTTTIRADALSTVAFQQDAGRYLSPWINQSRIAGHNAMHFVEECIREISEC